MNLVKSWIVVAAIAAAVSLEANAEVGLDGVCIVIASMLNRSAARSDGKLAFEFVKKELVEWKTVTASERSAIVNSWDNIHHGKGCSQKSWEYLVNLGICNGGLSESQFVGQKRKSRFEVLDEPYKAYAKQCVDYTKLEEKIKSAVSGYFAERLDFIDSQFIEKYRQDDSKDPATQNYLFDLLNIPYYCTPEKSVGAVIDAIQRDLEKKGKDPKKFLAKPTDLSKYLAKKLFKPCKQLEKSFKDLGQEIKVVAEHYEGGLEALIEPLSQEAKDIFFRYKYCESSNFTQRYNLFNKVVKEFVPEESRKITEAEKSIIEGDFGPSF